MNSSCSEFLNIFFIMVTHHTVHLPGRCVTSNKQMPICVANSMAYNWINTKHSEPAFKAQ